MIGEIMLKRLLKKSIAGNGGIGVTRIREELMTFEERYKEKE